MNSSGNSVIPLNNLLMHPIYQLHRNSLLFLLHCFIWKTGQPGKGVSSIFCQHYLLFQKQKPQKTFDFMEQPLENITGQLRALWRDEQYPKARWSIFPYSRSDKEWIGHSLYHTMMSIWQSKGNCMKEKIPWILNGK